MAEIKMYFGEIQTDESLPPLDIIAEQVKKSGLIEQEGRQLGIQEKSDRDEYYKSDDYFFVRYVQEVSENHPKIDGGRIQIGKNTPARMMRFLLTQDGKYACESTSQVEDSDALEYLIGKYSLKIDFECGRKNKFEPKRIEQFYDKAWKVRGLKLKRKNGIVDDVDLDTDIGSHVKNASNVAVRAEFSTEQQDEDLQRADIIDELVKLFDIYEVRRKDSSGNIHTIFHNGKYNIRYPSKLDIQQQSKEIHDVLLSMTDGSVQKSTNSQAKLQSF
ncbi:hypothetical protein [Halocatena salina]|uniref:Uncharacterized protein n=1 Tax=Halocatena salina TaxID=2934340 RepID=A0A8T9ZZ67_9EURY|nr:hypothetical protein [Halocatena salina]UPM42060.1 hypothetical protein MW046_08770 [Halocatena salina]